jgi:gliding motility-associated-like protein
MTSWVWSFGDNYITLGTDTSTSQNPTHLYNNVDTYLASLKVTNSFGCIDSISKFVKIEDEYAIYIPNAFSPTNTDGKNDIFKVAGIGFLSDSFEMTIYDRWGTLIYKTNDVAKGWDGTVKGSIIAKQDVYIYKIKLKDYKLRSKEYVGHITLL